MRTIQHDPYPEYAIDRKILSALLRLDADQQSTLHGTFCQTTRYHMARLASNGFTDAAIADELGYMVRQTEDEPRGPFDEVAI